MAEETDNQQNPGEQQPPPGGGDQAAADKAAADKAAADKAAADAAAAAAGAGPPWWEGIKSAEVKQVAARYATRDDWDNAHLEQRKAISGMIKLPEPNATPEQLKDFRTKMGVPADVKGYEPIIAEALPEGYEPKDIDTRFQDHMKGVFLKANVTAEQAKALTGEYMKFAELFEQWQEQSDKDYAAEQETKLRQELGPQYQRVKAAANTFLNDARIWDDPAAVARIETKDGHMLLDHPLLVKAFGKAGLLVEEDPLRAGLPAGERQTLEEELAKLHAHPSYWQSSHAEHKTTQDRVREIYQLLHGNQPIVGAAGRTL